MKDKIVVPYAPILVESTRSVGYSFEAAVAVRRIENLEKFNEIILELKRRPHGGRKALFLCVFAERNQVHPLQILFQLLPVGFRHGAGARQ